MLLFLLSFPEFAKVRWKSLPPVFKLKLVMWIMDNYKIMMWGMHILWNRNQGQGKWYTVSFRLQRHRAIRHSFGEWKVNDPKSNQGRLKVQEIGLSMELARCLVFWDISIMPQSCFFCALFSFFLPLSSPGTTGKWVKKLSCLVQGQIC